MNKTGHKTGILLMLMSLLIAVSAQAQAPAAENMVAGDTYVAQNKPTESDMYCSGYITNQPVAKNSYVTAGWDSPDRANYSNGDYVYLRGDNYKVGSKYEITRQIRDTSGYEVTKDQKKKLALVGAPYAEVGRVRVVNIQNNIGIALVEFSCDSIMPGDLAVPWVERPAPTYRRAMPFDQFAPPNGKLTGHIIMGTEFAGVIGTRHKVFLDVGSNQGVKPGDYFRATRTYDQTMADDSDSLPAKASVMDPTAKDPVPITPKDMKGALPRRSVGEMMVLYATPVSSTAMVTSSLEQLQIGDGVEMMEEPPPLPPPPPPPAANAPTISCVADPATVSVGDNSTIRCTGVSADNRPLTYTFVADSGTINPRENLATLNTNGVNPGMISVMATATDDRNLSANTTVRVTAQAPPPPAQASDAGNFAFKPRSARVDNNAKAVLDGIALRMQQEANSTVLLVGSTAQGESARLGIARANNAKTYLTKDKGIDANRVRVQDGGQAGRKVEMWFIPAGAATPNITPVAAAPPARRPAARKKAAPKK